MDTEQAAEMYAGLFPALYRRFHRRIHHSTYRLTAESLALLHHVAAAGPLTVTELNEHLDRSQAATSKMISRPVGRGVLGRLPDERDRRRVLIWVTGAGRVGPLWTRRAKCCQPSGCGLRSPGSNPTSERR